MHWHLHLHRISRAPLIDTYNSNATFCLRIWIFILNSTNIQNLIFFFFYSPRAKTDSVAQKYRKNYEIHLHLVIWQMLLSKATYKVEANRSTREQQYTGLSLSSTVHIARINIYIYIYNIHFWLLSVLKTVVLPNIFVQSDTFYFSGFFGE